ncbi:flagellin [Archaeoglobus veneficus]|uniref:Flagellin n=1 Tax=Archaeoglobus veneficus (strain DSM 11195 / SNP6) TaxID=693661 RepID=F2KP73_ARCVS|nr:flagellin [Archaeoglobus veneficus]AEA47477.1 flagellin [Archaeoglobus veneficus SNP6]
MGLSTSAASVVLLVAIVISASVLFNTISATQDIVRRAQVEKGELEYEQLHTHMVILNVTYLSGNLTITAKNDGSEEILVDEMEILLDGQIYTQNITSFTVNGVEVDVWLPGETAEINVTVSYQPSRVKIVAHNGVSAYWEG